MGMAEPHAWELDYEPVGATCPFGHPWGATERLERYEKALREIAAEYGDEYLSAQIARDALGEKPLSRVREEPDFWRPDGKCQEC